METITLEIQKTQTLNKPYNTFQTALDGLVIPAMYKLGNPLETYECPWNRSIRFIYKIERIIKDNQYLLWNL